jgi:hypothetical protein
LLPQRSAKGAAACIHEACSLAPGPPLRRDVCCRRGACQVPTCLVPQQHSSPTAVLPQPVSADCGMHHLPGLLAQRRTRWHLEQPRHAARRVGRQGEGSSSSSWSASSPRLATLHSPTSRLWVSSHGRGRCCQIEGKLAPAQPLAQRHRKLAPPFQSSVHLATAAGHQQGGQGCMRSQETPSQP